MDISTLTRDQVRRIKATDYVRWLGCKRSPGSAVVCAQARLSFSALERGQFLPGGCGHRVLPAAPLVRDPINRLRDFLFDRGLFFLGCGDCRCSLAMQPIDQAAHWFGQMIERPDPFVMINLRSRVLQPLRGGPNSRRRIRLES